MMYAGIDTHLKVHSIEIQNSTGKAMWRGNIKNDMEGFNFLKDKLRAVESSNNDTIEAIFMNPTGNYHMPVKYFLERIGYRVILVDSRISEHIRITSNLGKEKSDAVDASVLASTARVKPDIIESNGHERDNLSGITRLLTIVKSNMSRIINQVKSDIAAVFPEYPLYNPIDSKTSLALLEKYPTAELLRDAKKEEVFDLISIASRKHYKIEDAINFIQIAKSSIGIDDSDGIYAYRIRMNVKRLKEEKGNLNEIENYIIKRSENSSDIKNIAGIKGIGVIASTVIVSEIGDIKQFDSKEKLQAYGGKAPNIKGSGGKIHAAGVTKIRNPYLSSAVYECAITLVMHKNPEFLELFNREIGKGKKNVQAYIVVGKRFLSHIYSIMKNNKPYKSKLSGDNIM